MNPLQQLLQRKQDDLLNIFFTAGFPGAHDTIPVILALQAAGVDLVEIGMPYSDPLADGPFIQQANEQALRQGMSIPKLLDELYTHRTDIQVPFVLMGYLNPVMQYGTERFLQDAAAAGASGIILPDLPLPVFEREFKPLMQALNLCPVFLITPQTSEERIRQMDAMGDGFLYAVSSSATTGGQAAWEDSRVYFERLRSMQLKLPVLIGFGIRTAEDYQRACDEAQGAIIGTAFLQAIQHSQAVAEAATDFVQQVRPVYG
jgi:tryptophan synthase alpha chain